MSSGDLPMVYSMGVNADKPTFFFNKYFMEWDHVVMNCMEERLAERNKLEYVWYSLYLMIYSCGNT